MRIPGGPRATIVGGVVLVVVVLAGWLLWPDDDPPSLRDELAGVDGVVSVESTEANQPQVVLDRDADLESVRGTIEDVVAIVQDRDANGIGVDIGGVTFWSDNDVDETAASEVTTAAELAWAAAATDQLLAGRVLNADPSAEYVEISLDAEHLRPAAAVGPMLERLAAVDQDGADGPTPRIDVFTPNSRTHSPPRLEIDDLDLGDAQRRTAALANVLKTTRGRLTSGDLQDDHSSLTVRSRKTAQLAETRRRILHRFDPKTTELRLVAGGLTITSAQAQELGSALELVDRIRETGAETTQIPADLGTGTLEIQASGPREASEVLALTGTSDWVLQPDARMSVSLRPTRHEPPSTMTGDAQSLRRMAPLWLRVIRTGFKAEYQQDGGTYGHVLSIWEALDAQGDPIRSLGRPKPSQDLVDALRSGDWSGSMTFEILASRSVFARFVSTPTGRAQDVSDYAMLASDDQQQEVRTLADFVSRWNRTAG